MRTYRRHFLKADLLIGLAVSVAVTAWAIWLHGDKVIDGVLAGNRATLYGTLATLAGTLLGFIIATLTIFVAVVPDVRLERVRRSAQYPTLWRTLTSTIRWLGVGTLVGLACLLLDRDSGPTRWLELLGLFVWLVSALRMGWSIWIVEQVIRLLAAPQQNP